MPSAVRKESATLATCTAGWHEVVTVLCLIRLVSAHNRCAVVRCWSDQLSQLGANHRPLHRHCLGCGSPYCWAVQIKMPAAIYEMSSEQGQHTPSQCNVHATVCACGKCVAQRAARTLCGEMHDRTHPGQHIAIVRLARHVLRACYRCCTAPCLLYNRMCGYLHLSSMRPTGAAYCRTEATPWPLTLLQLSTLHLRQNRNSPIFNVASPRAAAIVPDVGQTPRRG